MKASVVINTYNRASYLGGAIRSIAAQSFEDVELIVVNGPSTDNTEDVLEQLSIDGYHFKTLSCATRNLSESRNVGISACAGDVVFFIDDDGVAHPRWVERLMRQYADPRVGAAGGFTLDHTGMGYQCRYTVCDRLGNAKFLNTLDPEHLLASGTGFSYPSLLGTNSSFRRTELLAIGGFDEVFAYMLDETDVCLRIFERGKRIVTVPDALVLHKYAPSHTRTVERIPNSLLAPARSKVYFMLKHGGKGGLTTAEIAGHVDQYRQDISFSNRWLLDHKKISASHYAKLSGELSAGIAEGMTLGFDTGRHSLVSRHLRTQEPMAAEHLRIREDGRYRQHERSLRIYLVSQGYPPHDTSGIARWTHECATGLAASGHEVHVVTRSKTDANHVDMVEGIWVHSVVDLFDDDRVFHSPVPLPDSILRRAEAVLKEILRSQDVWGVDVVSAPIWDVEGILCAAHLEVPVVTSLHTTYQLALPFKPFWQSNREYRRKHVNLVIGGEQWLYRNSTAVLANSSEIIREIESVGKIQLRSLTKTLSVVAHGLGAEPSRTGTPNNRSRGSSLNILFVGRIEERKGPDTFLGAIGRLPKIDNMLQFELIGQMPAPDDPFAAVINTALSKARANGSQTTVDLLGHVSEARLQEAYANCDIFVAPSRFESFGLILLEAMRWGKPIIACDIGGMREVIEHGKSGLLVPVGDEQALAGALSSLIENAALRAQLGANALERYRQQFTKARMAEGLEAFFSTIVRANA